MKVKVAFTVDQEVIEKIDNLRDLACRSAFINHVLKLGLKAYEGKAKAKRKETLNAQIITTTPKTPIHEGATNGKS